MPTGELPRNMSVLVDRLLVGKISPGTRVTVVGIYSVCGSKDSGGPKRKDTSGAVAIRQPYLRVVGVEGDLDEDARQTRAFTCGPGQADCGADLPLLNCSLHNAYGSIKQHNMITKTGVAVAHSELIVS